MKNDIKKIRLTEDDIELFKNHTRAWNPFILWLRTTESEEEVLKCLAYEIERECRPALLDRLRTRYNTLRAYRELSELEEITGKIISINFRK